MSFGDGVFPIKRSRLSGDVVAGLTLAALGIPEVLGYAKIAGMPLITGLYTILIPIALYALFGSSRHLVVGADSATAAVLAAGLLTLAHPASSLYVTYASMAALMVAVFLIIARIVRLGFLANFLSRTVLIGFLTGVGIQVAISQLGSIIGIKENTNNTVTQIVDFVGGLGRTQWLTLGIAVAVIVVIVAFRLTIRQIPGALVAVVASIVASDLFHVSRHGTSVVGHVPQGLPHFALPSFHFTVATTLLGTTISMFVIILAQSAATSRAYAAKYDEDFNENTDLMGLAIANIGAALSRTFVVNGSPTKTEMVDGAGGKSQISQLVTALVVLVVLLFATGPLEILPSATLAAIVFLIGVELVDVKGMRAIFAVRKGEFVVAALTALAVIFIGIEQGILLAMALSVIEHLRQGYHPRDTIVSQNPDGHVQAQPFAPGSRTESGIVIYRFGSSLYYANAQKFFDEVMSLTTRGDPLKWLCLDCPAIRDIDFTAGQMLHRVIKDLVKKGVTCCMSEVSDDLAELLERYEISPLMGTAWRYDTVGAVLTAYRDPGARVSV